MTTQYSFTTTVLKVEEKDRVVRGYLDDKGDAQTIVEKIGWYVLLDGSRESIYLGVDPPDLRKGQRVRITIEGL